MFDCEAERMKICQLLFFFLVLWDGAALIRAETVYEVAEGGNVTVGCQFLYGYNKKIFCKNDCNKEEDILVETSGNSGRNGRYSIEYEDRTFPSPNIMNVSITNVIRSDSGRYQCVLERWGKDGSQEFRIEVTNASASLNPTFTLKPAVIPSNNTGQTGDITSLTPETTTQPSLNQDPASFETSTPSEHQQNTTTSGGMLLYVGLTLVVIVIVLAAALLIFYRNKRANKPKAPPVNTVYGQIPEANRVYEEIQEDNRQSGSRPVEISTVYASASFSKPTEDQTSDLYSLAAAPRDQLQVENPSCTLNYSEVNLAKKNVMRR